MLLFAVLIDTCKRMHAMGRIGRAEEIANAIAFLAGGIGFKRLAQKTHDNNVWNGVWKLTSRSAADSTGFASITWKGREATRLSNGLIELTVLTGGGHLADLRFMARNESESQNVCWEVPWVTVDPDDDRHRRLAMEYGSIEVGSFLASYTGHALCMDTFGEPSAEQAVAGIGLHGEAGIRKWSVIPPESTTDAVCGWSVELPIAKLRFERETRLGNRESVVYINECVTNEESVDHACHWVQHATFGPPFLNDTECSVVASAQRGMTSRSGYEGAALLAKDREFLWPYAPRAEDKGSAVDLRKAFSAKGLGFIAGMQMDLRRKVQYILVVNWRLRLGVGYCFRQEDFPFMAIWEENFARQYSPWNGNTQARGMEFGTTPMPLSPGEAFPGKKLFDSPTWCVIPANGAKKARYLIFLVKIPDGMNSVGNVEVEGDAIRLYDAEGHASITVPANGCEEFLAGKQ